MSNSEENIKEGFIKLHRSLLDNPLFKSEPYTKGQAWVALLLLTNHERSFIKAKNGKLISIERGECGYSMVALSSIFRWDRRTVKRYIKLLENEKMVQQKIVENHSIIKVLNYEDYQECTTNGTTNGTQTINNSINNSTSVLSSENEKPTPEKKFTKPSLEEVKNYISDKNLTIDPERFFYYYEANGWTQGNKKMKSWQAAVQYWQRTEKKEQKEEENWSDYVDRMFGESK